MRKAATQAAWVLFGVLLQLFCLFHRGVRAVVPGIAPCLLNRVCHHVRGMLCSFLKKVSVLVQGSTCARMSQASGYFLYVHAGSDQQTCTSMSEGIKRSIISRISRPRGGGSTVPFIVLVRFPLVDIFNSQDHPSQTKTDAVKCPAAEDNRRTLISRMLWTRMYVAHELKIEVFGTGWKWTNSTQTVRQIVGNEAAGSAARRQAV